MDRKTFVARLRQIHVTDMNAFAIYTDLAKLTRDPAQRKIFSAIAKDEKKHVELCKRMISILEK
ncbi:MAG: hypothetical protein WC412_09195 [Candidatus Omnitrophota bacterium]|jgi:rubrerythrin